MSSAQVSAQMSLQTMAEKLNVFQATNLSNQSRLLTILDKLSKSSGHRAYSDGLHGDLIDFSWKFNEIHSISIDFHRFPLVFRNPLS